MKAVTPLQQLRAKRVALAGQNLGLLFALAVLIYQGLYYWVPFIVFSLFLLLTEYLGVQQQIWRVQEITGG